MVTADAALGPSGTRLGDAILVDGGRVAAVGSAEVLATRADRIDRHPGAVIVPGLRDAHLHPIGHAASLHRPSLKDAASLAEIADVLGEAAARQPADTAVVGMRLDDESLAEGRLPDRHLLDGVAGDRPVVAVRYCGHVSVANTAALEIAGIGPDTPDPPGGTIDRDDGGRPTGVLRETAAEMVSTAVRSLAPPVTASHLVDASMGLASLGLTGLGAMVATSPGCWAGAMSELDALLEAAPDLPLDTAVFVITDTPGGLEEARSRIDAAGGRLRFGGWKAFSDGSLGGHTAAMHEPFTDRDTTGTDRLDPAWALEMARTALRLDGRVAIHAIGDRANGRVLDLMERLLAEGADPARLRIEHASVLTETDIRRFGRLGITAVVQPAFLVSEADWLGRRLGSQRLGRTYAFRSLLDAGTPLAGSSDSPVEPPHPLWGMAAARDRAGVVPREGLTADEALTMFTAGSAAAIGSEAGLRPGDAADLTVLSADPLTTDPAGLRAAVARAVYVGGDAVDVPAHTTAWVA
ncbi:MAG: amidohydrolase [Acidimicrobiia bacterium]|nr:amidohydrolase [Acidimicrobiia bacterium]